MPASVLKATADYRNVSDRVLMFATQCLKKVRGQELRSKAVYKRYQDWCAENGFKSENISNLNKKLGQIFVYESRRPWLSKNEGATTMINDVTWATGEELQEGLVPEFEAISVEDADVITED